MGGGKKMVQDKEEEKSLRQKLFSGMKNCFVKKSVKLSGKPEKQAVLLTGYRPLDTSAPRNILYDAPQLSVAQNVQCNSQLITRIRQEAGEKEEWENTKKVITQQPPVPTSSTTQHCSRADAVLLVKPTKIPKSTKNAPQDAETRTNKAVDNANKIERGHVELEGETPEQSKERQLSYKRAKEYWEKKEQLPCSLQRENDYLKSKKARLQIVSNSRNAYEQQHSSRMREEQKVCQQLVPIESGSVQQTIVYTGSGEEYVNVDIETKVKESTPELGENLERMDSEFAHGDEIITIDHTLEIYPSAAEQEKKLLEITENDDKKKKIDETYDVLDDYDDNLDLMEDSTTKDTTDETIINKEDSIPSSSCEVNVARKLKRKRSNESTTSDTHQEQTFDEEQYEGDGDEIVICTKANRKKQILQKFDNEDEDEDVEAEKIQQECSESGESDSGSSDEESTSGIDSEFFDDSFFSSRSSTKEEDNDSESTSVDPIQQLESECQSIRSEMEEMQRSGCSNSDQYSSGIESYSSSCSDESNDDETSQKKNCTKIRRKRRRKTDEAPYDSHQRRTTKNRKDEAKRCQTTTQTQPGSTKRRTHDQFYRTSTPTTNEGMTRRPAYPHSHQRPTEQETMPKSVYFPTADEFSRQRRYTWPNEHSYYSGPSPRQHKDRRFLPENRKPYFNSRQHHQKKNSNSKYPCWFDILQMLVTIRKTNTKENRKHNQIMDMLLIQLAHGIRNNQPNIYVKGNIIIKTLNAGGKLAMSETSSQTSMRTD